MYKRLYVFLIYSFVTILSLYVCLNISTNTFSINTAFIHKKIVKALFPQGWSFFTKNPKDIELSIYNLKDNKFENLTNFQAKEYFGICRKNRLLNTKLIEVAKNIDDKLWIYSLEENSLKTDELAIVTIEDDLLKGNEFIINKYLPFPYSWHKSDLKPPKYSIIVKFL